MENLALKTKLAVLWLFVAVTMSANTILYFIVPGVIDEIRAGEVVGMQAGPELLLVMAIMYYWVPLVMAVLSLTLKDKANRWANIILGIFYAGFILFELIMNIRTVAYPYVILMDISAIVVAALIAWYAWKWSRQED
jgi:uncharacterized membrane protein